MTEDYKEEEYWKLVEEFVIELRTAKYWMKNDGKPLPEWKLFDTRYEAWNAAVDATWSKARSVAKSATVDAGRFAAVDATWRAARRALRSASQDAAVDIAWNAANDAVGDAARSAGLFARMLVCFNLSIDIKYLNHINACMQVWRKGYGLYCEINGILYVYKKVN